uniref:Cationic amino acid transporter C-terminal domain-containing protein n=1 Tax=Hyaloperonospora arabidopsidis (strain Emoy2) TaxID=559515 RepID=M4BKX6_HYAAE
MDRFFAAARRVKPLSRCAHGSTSLKKCLTLVDLVAYGVGCSVGAGVYSLVGVGAQLAGPSISLSFFISGVACVFTSLTYSEFAARVPVMESELMGVMYRERETEGSGIARSWASYAHLFLQHVGLHLPLWLVRVQFLGVSCSILAAVLVICCTFILLAGVHESAKFNSFVTLLNISVLLFVVVYGSTEVNPTYWEPFMPAGFHGVMMGAGVVFFAYLGFDMVACLAEEVHDPQRTLPKGIIGSLLISVTIYVGVSLVVTGMAPIDVLGDEVPLVKAFVFHNAPWAGRIVSFGSIFGLTTAAFTCLMGQPRIFYQMAKDGLLPSLFSTLNSRTHVPVSSTISTGILVALIAFVFELNFLANVISCGTLQVFTFVNAGVLLLRMRPSSSATSVVQRVLLYVLSCFALSLSFAFDLPWMIQGVFAILVLAAFVFICRLGKLSALATSFQCPLVPFVPCFGILANVYMMASIPGEGWLGVLIWLSVGLVVYLCYGIRHSVLTDHALLRPLI